MFRTDVVDEGKIPAKTKKGGEMTKGRAIGVGHSTSYPRQSQVGGRAEAEVTQVSA